MLQAGSSPRLTSLSRGYRGQHAKSNLVRRGPLLDQIADAEKLSGLTVEFLKAGECPVTREGKVA